MMELCPVCNGSIADGDSVCSACGFKLLGSTQSFQPLSLSADEVAPKTKKQPLTAAFFKVIRGLQMGTVFALNKDSFVIGRDPQCDIFLNDMTVSRNHALVKRVADVYEISDTNSFNGVWINNKSIDNVVLHDGDIIQIGAFCLLYQESMQG